ncbi:zinc finger protein ZPR1-like [Ptychodera flava]|uniref:zinc finger protein ZPR1-like n=1 Tax=Ptychodera flava TaxID=63121 RepID=UPI00396A9E28
MAEQPYGNKPLFRDLDAEDIEDREASELESLCVNCEETGITRLLLTRIPFYKDVILISFECPHCNYSNNEIQPGGKIQDQGCKYEVEIKTPQDLNRKVVKSDSASVCIPHLDLEIPSNTQKGILTTVEGVLDRVVTGLEQEQPIRRAMDPATADKIDEFIEKIKKLKDLESPFTITVDDPSGNSFIENVHAPQRDPEMKITYYNRTFEQDQQLGLVPDDNGASNLMAVSDDGIVRPRTLGQEEGVDNIKDEIMVFMTNCSNCNSPVETNMKLVPIPHFKEVIIMATLCEKCGHKTTEVKSGSGIEEKGRKITLKMTDVSDLNRDVLKSDTCGLSIPELDFELEAGTLGGKFTTLEGLLTNIKDQLMTSNPFMTGDSSDETEKMKLGDFVKKLERVISGDHFVKIVLDDPAGNSYLQNLYAPDDDPEMIIEDYERTDQHNELLGLTDMKTENYFQDS